MELPYHFQPNQKMMLLVSTQVKHKYSQLKFLLLQSIASLFVFFITDEMSTSNLLTLIQYLQQFVQCSKGQICGDYHLRQEEKLGPNLLFFKGRI